MLTFNVSPPMSARGIESYTATWDAFFAWFNKPLSFYFHDVDVVAGADVAYATALGNWAGLDPTGKRQGYAFRLTMGLRKFGNKWIVMHEHHSLPVG